jgi:LPXTG-motif cell wall-anchored protein
MIANVASDAVGAPAVAPVGAAPQTGGNNKTMLWVLGIAVVLIGAWYVKKEFIDKPKEARDAAKAAQ